MNIEHEKTKLIKEAHEHLDTVEHELKYIFDAIKIRKVIDEVKKLNKGFITVLESIDK